MTNNKRYFYGLFDYIMCLYSINIQEFLVNIIDLNYFIFKS